MPRELDKREVIVIRDEPDMDRAYDSAMRQSLDYYQVDTFGYFGNPPVDLDDSVCPDLEIELVKSVFRAGPRGPEMTYTFETRVVV